LLVADGRRSPGDVVGLNLRETPMLHQSIRYIAFGFAALLFLGGLTAVGLGGPDVASGVLAIVIGAAIMVVAVLQRSRYRSDAAERSDAAPGPGGGEVGSMEPRFVPTNEVFGDPTSGRVMRVFVDPRTGERRYRAEG
jgi:hypothetical protein